MAIRWLMDQTFLEAKCILQLCISSDCRYVTESLIKTGVAELALIRLAVSLAFRWTSRSLRNKW